MDVAEVRPKLLPSRVSRIALLILLVLLSGLIDAAMRAAKTLQPPTLDISVEEFMKLKSEGKIKTVTLQSSGLKARLREEIQRGGVFYSRLDVARTGSNREHPERLLEGLPPDSIEGRR